MPSFYDALEKRSADERLAELSEELPKLIELAKTKTTHYRESLAGFEPSAISSPERLASLPAYYGYLTFLYICIPTIIVWFILLIGKIFIIKSKISMPLFSNLYFSLIQG